MLHCKHILGLNHVINRIKSCRSDVNAKRKRTDYLNWDDYFMGMAVLSSQRSKDPKTQVGACIVDADNRIVAIGYNGLPRGCDDDEFPWQKDPNTLENKLLYVVHAEANAILNRNSIDLKGNRIYTTLFPCNECAKLIIQTGIREVIYMNDKEDDVKFQASRRMFEATGVTIKRHSSARKEIIIKL